MFKSSTTRDSLVTPILRPVGEIWGPEAYFKAVDSVSLFETEMYVFEIYSGYGKGKTFLFKRCLFLDCIGKANVVDRLVVAIKIYLLLFCYLYLL